MERGIGRAISRQITSVTHQQFPPGSFRLGRGKQLREDTENSPPSQLRPVLCRLGVLRLTYLHRKVIAVPLDHRLHIDFLARLGRKHKGGGQRHVHMGEGGVGAFTVRAHSQAITVSLRPT
jgi:hypothetical protein